MQAPCRIPGRNDGQAIRLVQLGGKLGGGLVAADADRAEYAGGLEYLAPGQLSDPCRRSQQALAAGDIQECLVNGKHLDIRGDVLQGRHDGGGCGGVAFRVGRALDQVRAQAACLLQPHAGMDAVAARLVGAGDDAGALQAIGDRQRAPAPLGPVTLLDRGEKGVHIHQHNGTGPGNRVISGIFCRTIHIL